MSSFPKCFAEKVRSLSVSDVASLKRPALVIFGQLATFIPVSFIFAAMNSQEASVIDVPSKPMPRREGMPAKDRTPASVILRQLVKMMYQRLVDSIRLRASRLASVA